MSLHHKLCHVLGGSFGLPHAETHAVMLPYTIAYNEPVVADLLRPVTETFGGSRAGIALLEFARKIKAPLSLRELGLPKTELGRAAELAMQAPYWNPRPLLGEEIQKLLNAAWNGDGPDR